MSKRWMFLTGTGVLLVAAAAVLLVRPDLLEGLLGVSDSQTPGQTGVGADARTSTPISDEQVEALRPKVAAFCGDCHANPSPSAFPRTAWHEEVEQGFELYRQSGRSDLSPPTFDNVVAYFRAQAPEKLLNGSPPPAGESPLRFVKTTVALPAGQEFAAISHLRWEPPADGRSGALCVCDMGSGVIAELTFPAPDPRRPQVREIARLRNPAHTESASLLGDDRAGILAADLGSFKPADHHNGQLAWIRKADGSESAQPHFLGDKWARVADARTADFDGDGDQDVLVAEFGWRETGGIVLLEQQDAEGDFPKFSPRVLDSRHGTIHVPITDVDGDGDLDFIALISQEYEVIEAFVNDGRANFERQLIFDGGDPSYGSSGIELVDLDGDGDLDILYTNGDTFDSHYIKPYHAVHWLENPGTFPYIDHHLTAMPGVYRAMPGDLDGDGDLDIVACACISSMVPPRDWPQNDPKDVLIWLEQTKPGEFARYRLLSGDQPGHFAIAIADLDADGDLDIAAGNFTNSESEDTSWLSFWWNEGPAP